jgi:hypothetical protein
LRKDALIKLLKDILKIVFSILGVGFVLIIIAIATVSFICGLPYFILSELVEEYE